MPKKVKIRLYVYKKNEDTLFSTSYIPSQVLTNTQYLLTVSEIDIVSKSDGNYVYVGANDIVEKGNYKVFLDTNSNYYIVASKIINGQTGTFTPTVKGAVENIYISKAVITNRSNNDLIEEEFEFYLNPQHLTPTYKKLITEIRTRGGWEVQHWGNALTEVRVEGKSGGLYRVIEGGKTRMLNSDESVIDSTAWQKLDRLKSIYDNDQSISNQTSKTLLGMNYYNRFFIGYFSEFTGPEADAQQPYMVNFSFNFKVLDEKHIVSSNGGSIVL